MQTIYNFIVQDSFGKDVALEKYRGKVLLVVNTASKGAEWEQLKKLQKLYEEFQGRPFEILAFPCRQFFSLESKDNEKIYTKYKKRYKITFPFFKRINVNGKLTAPIYLWLRKERIDTSHSRINWNFAKFLVEADGITTTRFSSKEPLKKVKKAIEAAVVKCENGDFPQPFVFHGERYLGEKVPIEDCTLVQSDSEDDDFFGE